MSDKQPKINYASTEDEFVIASRRAINDGMKDLCFFQCGAIPQEVNGKRWKAAEITDNSYCSANFRMVGICDRAFKVGAEETAKEFCDELNRDVPEYDWVVLKYTKVEAFQEV